MDASCDDKERKVVEGVCVRPYTVLGVLLKSRLIGAPEEDAFQGSRLNLVSLGSL